MQDNNIIYNDILLLLDKLLQIEGTKKNINERNNDLNRQISEKEELINNLKNFLIDFYSQSDEYKYFYEYKMDRARKNMDKLYLEIARLKSFFIDENVVLMEEIKIKNKLLQLMNMIYFDCFEDDIFFMNSVQIREKMIKIKKKLKTK